MIKHLQTLLGHRKFLGLMDKMIYRASTFIVVILFSKILTKEQFGLFGLATSLFMLFSILESFFQTATVKFCATSNKEKLSDTINSLLYLKIFSVLVFVVLLWVLRPVILNIYKEPGLNEILTIFPFLFLFFTLRSHFVSIIRAQRDMKGLVWQDTLFTLVHIGLSLFLIKNITSARDAFEIYLVSHIISVVYLWVRYPQYCKFKMGINKDLAWEIFHYGKYSALVGVGGVLYLNLDVLMVGALTSVEAVGIYKIGRMSATFILTVSQGILLTMLPEISHLNEKNKILEIKKLYFRNVKLMLQIFVPFFILSLLFTHTLFTFFFQDKYVGADIVFIIFAASGIIRAFGNPQGALLAGVGLMKLDSIQMMWCLAVNLLMNFLLIPSFKSIGAAISTIIALLVGTLLKKYFLEKHYFLKKGYILGKA
jgi:O-antigen/teichoic acid export membrane protein